MQITKYHQLIILSCVAALSFGAGMFTQSKKMAAIGDTPPPTSTSSAVAWVNKQPIYPEAINPALQQGISKPVAIDSAVTWVILAKAAQEEYKDKLDIVVDSAKITAMAKFYMTEKESEFLSQVTEDEIKTYYSSQLADENFTKFKLKFHLSGTPEEGLQAGMDKFEYMNNQGDKLIGAREIPYGLYSQVKKLKKGDRSAPLGTRNGYFVFYIEDIVTQELPPLADVKEVIRNKLVKDKIEKLIAKLRLGSVIELAPTVKPASPTPTPTDMSAPPNPSPN